jgi:hypothetical protein
MIDPISIAISLISLGISFTTLWITLLRRGRLRMTKPTIVFFGYDFEPRVAAKIFLRTLLYSTSARGKVIEGMYAKLEHAGSVETFSFWGYGETNEITPGSGLYVGKDGVAANHHFVLSMDRPPYEFTAGRYTVKVFARLVGKHKPLKLSDIEIGLRDELVAALSQHNGVLFELGSDNQGYVGHKSERPAGTQLSQFAR